MDERDVVVSIGARRYAARLAAIDPASLGEQIAVVTLAETDLAADPPDFASALRIFGGDDPVSPTIRLFTGFVLEADRDGVGRWRLKTAKLATWQERTAGPASFDLDARGDILWQLHRSNGVPPGEIPIPRPWNWHPEREIFAVAVPIEGLEPEGEVRAGPVGAGEPASIRPAPSLPRVGQRRADCRSAVWARPSAQERRSEDPLELRTGAIRSPSRHDRR